MTNTDLKRAMMQHVNGAAFITVSELCAFLGYSKNTHHQVKQKYLYGLEKVGTGYFIPDVVVRIMNARKD